MLGSMRLSQRECSLLVHQLLIQNVHLSMTSYALLILKYAAILRKFHSLGKLPLAGRFKKQLKTSWDVPFLTSPPLN